MRKKMFLVALLSIFVAFNCFAENLQWQKIGIGIREAKITAAAIHPSDPSIIFAGTQTTIYKSKNQGKDFAPAFQIPGRQAQVNFLYIDPQETRVVYAATDSGLYTSKDNGENWQRIFYGCNKKRD